MPDTFEEASSSSAHSIFAITKSDETEFDPHTRALYIGGTGDVAVRMVDGTTAVFVAVPGGSILPLRTTQVLAAGTTATSIIGLV